MENVCILNCTSCTWSQAMYLYWSTLSRACLRHWFPHILVDVLYCLENVCLICSLSVSLLITNKGGHIFIRFIRLGFLLCKLLFISCLPRFLLTCLLYWFIKASNPYVKPLFMWVEKYELPVYDLPFHLMLLFFILILYILTQISIFLKVCIFFALPTKSFSTLCS